MLSCYLAKITRTKEDFLESFTIVILQKKCEESRSMSTCETEWDIFKNLCEQKTLIFSLSSLFTLSNAIHDFTKDVLCSKVLIITLICIQYIQQPPNNVSITTHCHRIISLVVATAAAKNEALSLVPRSVQLDYLSLNNWWIDSREARRLLYPVVGDWNMLATLLCHHEVIKKLFFIKLAFSWL